MPDVSRDLADKVEAASTRNTIKAVGEGRPLSPSEEDRLQRERLPQITAEELNRERQAALLLKWRKGQRLSEAEKAEIKSFLPSDKAAARKASIDSKLHTNAHYAAVYGVSEKTIKNWCRDGRGMISGPDLPPLDAPDKMAAWYARTHLESKVPPKLMGLARARQPSSSPPAAPGTPSSPSAPSIDVEDFAFDQAVRYAAENLAYSQEQLRTARTTVDPATKQLDERRIAQLEQAVNKAQESYRKAKADEHEHAQRNGQLVDRRVVFASLRQRLNDLHQGMRSVPVRAATKLAMTPEDTRQLVAAMNDELDALFSAMRDDRWIYKDRLSLES
jgi:hypothetical protein